MMDLPPHGGTSVEEVGLQLVTNSLRTNLTSVSSSRGAGGVGSFGFNIGDGLNYSVAERSIGEKLNIDPKPPDNKEVALLIVVATVGMVGNFGILIVILVLSSLRRASNAFLFHQSALDLLKSAYCLPFAQTMVTNQPPAFCSMMGGSYIVFVTTSAFNLLAIVMNEAYQFADLMMGIKDSRNYCCVIFGIFMIWFASIIMNLGVAFIPGNPSFDREMGHCIFVYGITRNYVLHMLWIVLITMALVLTFVYLRMLYIDIKRSSYYRMTTLIRATVSIDTNVRTASQRRQSYQREKHHVKRVLRVTRKKLYLLIALTVFFILFWYPLFMLTAGDPGFDISPEIYKTFTIVAWCNPTITPIILFFFIKTVCCCRDSDTVMTLLTEGLPAEHQRPNQNENDFDPHGSSTDGRDDDEREERNDGGETRRLNEADSNTTLDPRMQTPNSGIYNQFYARDAAAISMSSLSSQGGAVGGDSLEDPSGLLSHLEDSTCTDGFTVTDGYCLQETSLSINGAGGGVNSISSVASRLDGGVQTMSSDYTSSGYTSTSYSEALTRASSVDVHDTPENRANNERRRGHQRKDSKSASLWI